MIFLGIDIGTTSVKTAAFNEKLDRAVKTKYLHEAEVLEQLLEHLNNGKNARSYDCAPEDKELISRQAEQYRA